MRAGGLPDVVRVDLRAGDSGGGGGVRVRNHGQVGRGDSGGRSKEVQGGPSSLGLHFDNVKSRC